MTPSEAAQKRWYAVDRVRTSFAKEHQAPASMLSMLVALQEERTGLLKGATGMGKLLGIGTSAASETIRLMERAGWVERVTMFTLREKKQGSISVTQWADPNIKSIVLTPKGRSLLESYLSAMTRAYRSVSDPDSVDDLQGEIATAEAMDNDLHKADTAKPVRRIKTRKVNRVQKKSSEPTPARKQSHEQRGRSS